MYNNDLNKIRSAQILSCYGVDINALQKAKDNVDEIDIEKSEEDSESEKSDDEDHEDLEKGGEGSRGGKIIGHTESGKPIYNHFDHPKHADFTSADHHDAAGYNKDRKGFNAYANTIHHINAANEIDNKSIKKGEDLLSGLVKPENEVEKSQTDEKIEKSDEIQEVSEESTEDKIEKE